MKSAADDEVEGGVEIRGEPSRRRLEHRQPVGDRSEERQRDQRADQPRREIAERQAELHRIAAGSFQHRVDGAADIRAEHHRERRLRAEQAGRRERHHGEHDDDARMRAPRSAPRRARCSGAARASAPQAARARWRSARSARSPRTRRFSESSISPRPISDAADILEARAAPLPEGEHADRDQHREDDRHVEGEHLHDQRRADIRAEHHRERRNELDRADAGQRHHHQRGRGRGLQRGGHAKSRHEGAEPRAQPAPERAAEIRCRRRASRRSGSCGCPRAAARSGRSD